MNNKSIDLLSCVRTRIDISMLMITPLQTFMGIYGDIITRFFPSSFRFPWQSLGCYLFHSYVQMTSYSFPTRTRPCGNTTRELAFSKSRLIVHDCTRCASVWCWGCWNKQLNLFYSRVEISAMTAADDLFETWWKWNLGNVFLWSWSKNLRFVDFNFGFCMKENIFTILSFFCERRRPMFLSSKFSKNVWISVCWCFFSTFTRKSKTGRSSCFPCPWRST